MALLHRENPCLVGDIQGGEIMDKVGLVVVIISVIIILFMIIGVIVMAIQNENNRITEGIIIDKDYHSAYITTDFHEMDDVMIPETVSHEATYFLLLRGEKNEVEVEYWLECTEYDYYQYRVGDYYKK